VGKIEIFHDLWYNIESMDEKDLRIHCFKLTSLVGAGRRHRFLDNRQRMVYYSMQQHWRNISCASSPGSHFGKVMQRDLWLLGSLCHSDCGCWDCQETSHLGSPNLL
jgi:hypothetical protein